MHENGTSSVSCARALAYVYSKCISHTWVCMYVSMFLQILSIYACILIPGTSFYLFIRLSMCLYAPQSLAFVLNVKHMQRVFVLSCPRSCILLLNVCGVVVVVVAGNGKRLYICMLEQINKYALTSIADTLIRI